jgi:cyclopropane-fatty-acyl-phospholipid synthase
MKKNLLIGVIAVLVLLVPVFLYIRGTSSSQEAVQELLDKADIKINGNRPWDIQVHNPKLYDRVFQQGSLGLGEAYMDGWWDCAALDQFFDRVFRAQLECHVSSNWTLLWHGIKAKILNLQTKERSQVVGKEHYDLGNLLYGKMLDSSMTYSCGYWHMAETIEQAQQAKLDLICKKLQLAQGMKLLDIGCGWGGLACYAAKHYGVEVVGITISREQAEYAQERCKGLPVTILFQDYRDLTTQFDRVVSVGMFEHVGYKNYREFMEVVDRCLKDDGLFLLHTIGGNSSTASCDPWINKYIFPNSMLPSMVQISAAIENIFIMEDWHNFGPHYDTTLLSWHKNFVTSWPNIKDECGYDERFYRMWSYYLLSCAGLFRAREAQLWQLVLSKKGHVARYDSIR